MHQIVIAISLTATLGACVNWSREDTIREAAYGMESGIDMMQTHEITAACHEENPIVGRCGRRMSPETYISTTVVLHALISSILPPVDRRAWQYVTMGIEGSTVASNAFAGY